MLSSQPQMFWDYSGDEGTEVEVERVALPRDVEEHLYAITHPVTRIPTGEIFGDYYE